MAEVYTLSSVVDECIRRSGRIDRLADITAYANNTFKETQIMRNFYKDRLEVEVDVTASPHIWTTPDDMRQIEAVAYVSADSIVRWPKFKQPGPMQADPSLIDGYWYATATYHVFNGAYVGELVDISYFRHLRRLAYYTEAARPAVFDDETQAWTYLPQYSTALLQEGAKALVTNWLMQHYWDLVVEGTLAKLFKVISDEKRATMTYSSYKQLQALLVTAEPFEKVRR